MMLWATFEKPYVPLTEICEEYFGLCPKRAKAEAAAQKLPVPVIRLSDSRKSPYMVKLKDLAAYLDSRHQIHTKDWEKVQGVN